MSWFKRHFGMDLIDFAIQFVLTGFAMGALSSLSRPGPAQDVILFSVAGASLLIFAVRRRLGLKRLQSEPAGLTSGQMQVARIEELEGRMADLEAAQVRILELEERLDFAERLLAQQSLGVPSEPRALDQGRDS